MSGFDVLLSIILLKSQAKLYAPKRHNVDAYSQRQIVRAVKRARHMALLPFTVK